MTEQKQYPAVPFQSLQSEFLNVRQHLDRKHIYASLEFIEN